MKTFLAAALLALLLACPAPQARAGWFDDFLKSVSSKTEEKTQSPPESTAPAGTAKKSTAKPAGSQTLSIPEMDGGIKDALSLAVKTAVTQLGQENGFFANQLVRIAMPESLVQAENLLRQAGQGKLADQFIESMNRAAEQAVPKTTRIFQGAISKMTIQEAVEILKGPDDAATKYFEEKTRGELSSEILPVVTQATDTAQVTYYYKAMTDKAYAAAPFLKGFAPDLDQYVTQKALDGLFLVMAQEEKKIRQDPAARATDLLKKVFGAFSLPGGK
ncbi:MAG: DUF4197 domain-containing protein [Thermodesulfobacteriota bacterium]